MAKTKIHLNEQLIQSGTVKHEKIIEKWNHLWALNCKFNDEKKWYVIKYKGKTYTGKEIEIELTNEIALEIIFRAGLKKVPELNSEKFGVGLFYRRISE